MSPSEIEDLTLKRPSRVVYTALLGNYEKSAIRRPLGGTGIEGIIFTDDRTMVAPDGWRCVNVTPRFSSDTVRSARYLKIMGHPRLEEYSESLWIDNRVTLTGGLHGLFDMLDDHEIALPYHSFRTSVRDEFAEVIAAGYDSPERVRMMYEIARETDVLHQRPFWTGIMLRKNTPHTTATMTAWWELLLLTSRRDQLSINAALTRSPLRTKALDLDNVASPFHNWASHREIGRNKSVQFWKPNRSGVLMVGDIVRSIPGGRKAIRAMSRAGIEIPSLPS